MFTGARSVYDLSCELSAEDRSVIAAYENSAAGSQRAQNHIEIEAPVEITDGEQWEKERQETHAAERAKLYPDVYVNGEDVTVTIDPYGKRGRHSTFEMRDDTMFWRHKAAEHRGALKDHRVVMDVMKSLDEEGCYVRSEANSAWFEGSIDKREGRVGPDDPQGRPQTMNRGGGGVCITGRSKHPPENFTPTSKMIDAMPKLTPRCNASSTWGYGRMGSSAGAGVLYDELRGAEVPFESYGQLPIISQQIYQNQLRDNVTTLDLELHYENAPLNFMRQNNRAFDCGEMSGVPCR